MNSRVDFVKGWFLWKAGFCEGFCGKMDFMNSRVVFVPGFSAEGRRPNWLRRRARQGEAEGRRPTEGVYTCTSQSVQIQF